MTGRGETGRDLFETQGARGAAELLRILDLPSEERAELIGRLHMRDDGAALAELLIDVEGDPDGITLLLKEELRRALGV